jgi:hypothetical protein
VAVPSEGEVKAHEGEVEVAAPPVDAVEGVVGAGIEENT